MYKAKIYVGAYRPGEMIPEGMLTREREQELEKMGAIEKIAPVFMAGEEGDTSSHHLGDLPIEGEGKDNTAEMVEGTAEEAEAEEAEEAEEFEEAEEVEAEAPEIDLMDGIVEEDAPKEAPTRGRGSRSK